MENLSLIKGSKGHILLNNSPILLHRMFEEIVKTNEELKINESKLKDGVSLIEIIILTFLMMLHLHQPLGLKRRPLFDVWI